VVRDAGEELAGDVGGGDLELGGRAGAVVAAQEVGGALVEEDVQAGDAGVGVGLGGAGEAVQGGGRDVDQADAAAGLDVLRRGDGGEGDLFDGHGRRGRHGR